MEKLKDFSNIKVLIVGDVMIDRYWWGKVERVSPEAPVPVVHLSETTIVAGGAANVAANVAGLGAKPFLVGVVGDDNEARLLPDLLKALKINPEFLIKLDNRPTTVKTRVIAHSQQVARIDQETNSPITAEDEEKLWAVIKKIIDETQIIIVSDYAKGLLTETLLERLITKANENNKPILIDPKGKSFAKYKNASVITPNQREIAEVCAGSESIGSAEFVERCGEKLFSELNLKALLVTRGEEGMSLLEKNKKPFHLKASARAVYDVTGAGDTVIATLGVALGAGFDLAAAANLANTAAGLVVEQVGTTAIKFDDLSESLEMQKDL